MPPNDWPLAQSEQATAVGATTVFMESEAWRHVPAFLNAHHAGSVAADATRTMPISWPVAWSTSVLSWNEHTSTSLPLFVSHANALFSRPPSPRQWSQRILTPGAPCAAVPQRTSASESAVRWSARMRASVSGGEGLLRHHR